MLVTGVAGSLGASVARALEAHPGIEAVVGVDSTVGLDSTVGPDNSGPTVVLERTELVYADEDFPDLEDVVDSAGIDTVVHAGLVTDSTRSAARCIHERNVIGTLNLLSALDRPASKVDTLVVGSSALVYGAGPKDPHWFDEDAPRCSPAATPLERSLLEAEDQISSFARDRPGVAVAVLRAGEVLGPGVDTPLGRALRLPAVPQIAGFDPPLQFVEPSDLVRAVVFAIDAGLEGIFNVAPGDRLPWSELIRIAGRLPLYLPPLGTGLAAETLAALRIIDLPPEVLALLRYGRGVDSRRIERAGFTYAFTTAEAVRRLAASNEAAGSSRAAAPRAEAPSPRR